MKYNVNKARELIENTDMTISQIAAELGVSNTWFLKSFVYPNYSKEYLNERKRKNYARSKTGDKNPMTGLTGSKHHNYRERVSDGKGYWMILKPDWYTGRKGSNYVFEHHVVICKALGITEIPAGWVVHHLDEDKQNNNINNLILMTMEAHTKLHCMLRKCRD